MAGCAPQLIGPLATEYDFGWIWPKRRAERLLRGKIVRNVAHVFGAHAGRIGLHDASSLLVLECLQLKHEIGCRLSLEYRRGFTIGSRVVTQIAEEGFCFARLRVGECDTGGQREQSAYRPSRSCSVNLLVSFMAASLVGSSDGPKIAI